MPERVANPGVGATMGEIVLDGVLYNPSDLIALIEEVERLRTKASALADAVKAQHTASRAMEIDPTPERQEALAMAAYQVGVALGAFDR